MYNCLVSMGLYGTVLFMCVVHMGLYGPVLFIGVW